MIVCGSAIWWAKKSSVSVSTARPPRRSSQSNDWWHRMARMAAEGKPRRIITAPDSDGRTRLARVEEVPAVSGAALPPDVLARNYPHGAPDVRVVWGTEELPFTLPAGPEPPSTALPGP